MRDHSKLAIELARTSNAQNHSLNVVAQEAKRESRTMKVVTVIAMTYLPASLIAVSDPSICLITSLRTRLNYTVDFFVGPHSHV
jgi:hypothetical protein